MLFVMAASSDYCSEYKSENIIKLFKIITCLLVPGLIGVLYIKKENCKLLKLLK